MCHDNGMTEKPPVSPEKPIDGMTLAELEQKITILSQELQGLLHNDDPEVLAKLQRVAIPRKINERALYEMRRQKLLSEKKGE